MELIILHSKTSRRVRGSFMLCGDRQYLIEIANQILEQCMGKGWSYGWVDIVGRQEALANQYPVEWDTV